jgi:hypothetical protein
MKPPFWVWSPWVLAFLLFFVVVHPWLERMMGQ